MFYICLEDQNHKNSKKIIVKAKSLEIALEIAQLSENNLIELNEGYPPDNPRYSVEVTEILLEEGDAIFL